MKNKDISKYFFFAIIFTVMFLEILGQNLVRQSPLYINLMEQSAYARRGFDHTELQKIPNPVIDNEWVIFGKGARIIRNAPLPNMRKSSLFTPRKNRAEEFTIIIPVEFNSGAIAYLNEGARSDILHTAGVYFEGIGENWEIYFNGNLIRSEMYLDEAGRIVSQRFWRDLYFPIDKEDIVPGTNILALRILGDPAFESTGLRSRVHYIDDYRNIVGQQRNFYQIVQCAIFVFSALMFLLIFFYVKSRQEIYYLWFSIFSLMLCVYTVMRHGTINAFIPNSYASRLVEYLSLMLVIIAFSTFVEISLRGKITIFIKAYYIFCALLAFTQILILGHWGEEAIMLFDLSILVYIIYVVFYDILYLFVFDKKRALNNGRSSTEILNISSFYIITGTLIVCLSGVFEIVGFVFLFDLLPFRVSTLFINSTIAVQIGMTFMLSQRFGVLYTQLKQSNIILEATVKERTRELEEQTAIAVEASKAKSEFLAAISHDLKTPLSVMSVNLETLSAHAQTQSNAQYQRYVRTAYQKNLDLQRLVQNLFEAGRLETNLSIYTPQWESMLTLLARAHEKYEAYLEDKGLAFEIIAGDDREIMVDPQKIWSVFDNIVYNSVRHTQSGGITINAGSADSSDETSVTTITITDTGCGIEPEHLPFVFERFYKVSKGRNGSEGESGLGLYLVKNIMESCGGSVSIDSEPDKGTVVILTFKVRKNN